MGEATEQAGDQTSEVCDWCERPIVGSYVRITEHFDKPQVLESPGDLEHIFCSHSHVLLWVQQVLADLAREEERESPGSG